MQGRKTAGTLFLGLFLACFISVMIFCVKIAVVFYHMAFDFSPAPDDVALCAAGLAGSFIAAIIVYIISLIDTIRADKTPPPIPGSQD